MRAGPSSASTRTAVGVIEARPRGERVADVVGDAVVVEHDAGDAALRVAGVGVLEHVLRHERDAAAVLAPRAARR